MKCLSFLAFAGFFLSAAASDETKNYKNARVVPNVLSSDSIAKLVSHTRRLADGENTSDGKNRFYGEAPVPADDFHRMLRSIGDKRMVTDEDFITIRSTLVTGDTDPHKDAKSSNDEFEDDEEVIIVFLNDNENAFFQIGEDQIPAVAGTMVSFKGNSVDHNTVVTSGSVQLLGPVASRDLQGVSPPECDVDIECGSGVCFNEVSGGNCPTKALEYLFHVHKYCDENVMPGEYCEGGGECGNEGLNNCDLNFHGYGISFDVYQRVECCDGCPISRKRFLRTQDGRKLCD